MAKPPSSAARDRVRATVPKLIDVTEKTLFGDIWERPELSKRDRSLITCAVLVATYRPEQLRGHLGRALFNGLSKEELVRTHHPCRLLRRLAGGHDGGEHRARGVRGE